MELHGNSVFVFQSVTGIVRSVLSVNGILEFPFQSYRIRSPFFLAIIFTQFKYT